MNNNANLYSIRTLTGASVGYIWAESPEQAKDIACDLYGYIPSSLVASEA